MKLPKIVISANAMIKKGVHIGRGTANHAK